MPVAPSDVLQAGEYAYKLKEMIAEHDETGAKLYKLASTLLRDIEDLESDRQGRISESMPELDRDIADVQIGMRGIVLACEKALEKHHNPGIFGRIKSYFNIRKLKEKIKDMDNEVNAIHQRFMRRTQIQQTTVQATQFAAIFHVQETIANLQQGMDRLLNDASNDEREADRVFGVEAMSIQERKRSLQKASMDLAVASEEADRKTLELKIRILEGSIRNVTGFFAEERTAPPEGYESIYKSRGREEKSLHKRDDAIQETISLLRALHETDTPIVPIVWFRRANLLSASLGDLGFYDEGLLLSQICHSIIQELHKQRASAYVTDLASSFHNLGIRFSDLNRFEEAVENAKEAVEIRSELARNNPGVFDADLSSSYHNLARFLFKLGKGEEAIKSIQAAIDSRKILAEEEPELFEAKLASSYHDLAEYRFRLNEFEAAEEAEREAARIMQGQVMKDAEAYSAALAQSYHKLAGILRRLDKYEEAEELERLAEDVMAADRSDEPSASPFGDLLQLVDATYSRGYTPSHPVVMMA